MRLFIHDSVLDFCVKMGDTLVGVIGRRAGQAAMLWAADD